MRVLPKIFSEVTEMFRFFSCKFRIEKSKLKAARVVLWKEFRIMNCFTLESSFHGYFDKSRRNRELMLPNFFDIGKYLGVVFQEYSCLVEEDERQKQILKEIIKKKKKKMRAKDIVRAFKVQDDFDNQKQTAAEILELDGDKALVSSRA
jgi:hypothetical protein